MKNMVIIVAAFITIGVSLAAFGSVCVPIVARCTVDWIATSSMVSAGSLAIAATAAVYGINKWKHEQLSNRRQEAALDMLKVVHKARSIISRSLLWSAFGSITEQPIDREMMDQAFGGNEHDADYWSTHYRSATAYLKIMSQTEEFWSEYQGVTSKTTVVLGVDGGEAMDDLTNMRVMLSENAEQIRRIFKERIHGEVDYDQDTFYALVVNFPFNMGGDHEGWPQEDLAKKLNPDIEIQLEAICKRCRDVAEPAFSASTT